jgi:hypothetical protein
MKENLGWNQRQYTGSRTTFGSVIGTLAHTESYPSMTFAEQREAAQILSSGMDHTQYTTIK